MREETRTVGAFSFALLFALSSPIQAQEKQLTFRDVLSLKTPGSVTVSRDGKHVAYTVGEVLWKESRIRTHIWLLDTETGERRQHTRGASSESSPEFSPDGRYLAFSSRRADPDASSDDAPTSQVWLIPVGGGEATKLTSAKDGVRSFVWGPDSKSIFYTTSETLDEGTLARRKARHKQRFDEVEFQKRIYKTEIWKIGLESKTPEMVFAGELDLSAMSLSPDGKQLAFTTNRTGLAKDDPQSDVWIFETEAGEARQLTTRHGKEGRPTFSPGGQQVLFTAPLDTHTSYSQTELFMVPSGGGTPVNLTADFDRSPSSMVFTGNGRDLLITVAEGFFTHLYHLNGDTRELTPLIEGDVTVRNLSLAADVGKVVYTRSSGNDLDEIYISDVDGTGERKLSDFTEQLKEFKLARQEVITWRSKDGTPVEGLLLYPLDYVAGTRVPLIVSPHGGPHSRSTGTFQGEYQVWATKGYATLAPNFRGSVGYGAAFDVANKKDIGFGDFDDLMTGVDAVIEMGVADPDRMGIQGGSYGGFMTNWAITHTDRFKGAVSKYGLWHLVTDWSNSNNTRWELNYLESFYWNDMEQWLRHSPGTYLKNVTTPVLILHGEDDPNTALANSREMYQALSFAGKTAELVIYPREVHGIRREPNHIIDRQQRVVDWLGKYVLNQPEALPTGTPVVEGEWELTVRGVESRPTVGEEGVATVEAVVDINVRHLGQGHSELSLDLLREVYLRTGEDREVAPLGLMGAVAGAEALLKVESLTLSQADEYGLRLVFRVPAKSRGLQFKMKEFPAIALDLAPES